METTSHGRTTLGRVRRLSGAWPSTVSQRQVDIIMPSGPSHCGSQRPPPLEDKPHRAMQLQTHVINLGLNIVSPAASVTDSSLITVDIC